MKILVMVKQVPGRDGPVRIAADGRWIDERDLSWRMNEPDDYALEEALRLKDAAGGADEVVVVGAGPERVISTLREALAKGADRAVHVVAEDLASLDALQVAELMAPAVREECPELVLTGLQSDDLGMGQTGVVLAELLGMVQVSLITGIERLEAGLEPGLRVTRELEDGWSQTLEIPLPAVLSVQSGRNRPRYATLMGIKRAKSKEVRTVMAEMGVAPRSVALERVSLPQREKAAAMLTGSAVEIAAQLAERLKFDVGVL